MSLKRLPTLLLLLRAPRPQAHPPHFPRAHTHHFSSLVPRTQHHPHPYSTAPPSPKRYSFDEISTLLSTPSPSPSPLLIDVREPSELASTGRIPGSVSMPLSSNPDAVYLSPEDFHARFGFEKPSAEGGGAKKGDGSAVADIDPETVVKAGHGGADPSADLGDGGGEGEEGEGVREVIFYCKAGVRSRAAARMAAGEGGWTGVKIGEMGGGWDEWAGRGGKVER